MNLKDWKNKIKENYGEGVIASSSRVPRFSSGIFSQDLALGDGWPRGRIVLIVGPESSGKTYDILKAISEINKINWDTGELDLSHSNPTPTLFIDVEGTFDSDWAVKVGVYNDFEDVNLVMKPSNGEMVADVVYDALMSKNFGLICVDSLEACIPKEEEEKSADEHVVGKRAKMLNRGFRVWTSAMIDVCRELPEHQWPTLFCINQPRQKIGVMFGSPETLPGGDAQKFYPSVRVDMRTAKIADSDKKAYGIAECSGIVKKNKTAPARKKFSFNLATLDQSDTWKKGDVDNISDVFKAAKDYSLLAKSDEGYEALGWTFSRQKDFKESLKDPEFFSKVSKELRKQILELKADVNNEEAESSSIFDKAELD